MKINYLKKYIKEELDQILEIFDKSLPNIEKISPTSYVVGNGDNIEAKYNFRRTNINDDKWDISWSFTDNNKNTTPEAWKQITATSYKILSDFINTKHPQSIEISGDTDSKTNLYKSHSFINKLQNLLNNQYIIDNSLPYSVVINKINHIAQPNITKRMNNMNESYLQSRRYWEEGNVYSKSKIEQTSAIKKIVKRIIIEHLYNI
jgi:hypothetical protein